MMSLSFLSGITALIFTLFLTWRSRKPKHGPLPPGPKPMPVIGNVRDLPPKHFWLAATNWYKQYGDICYLHVFGQGIVFLNTREAASDLLDKRGGIYSDKPRMVMAVELCGCDSLAPFMGYGDEFRRHRKLMQRALGVSSVRAYQPLMENETHALLRRLLASPDDYGNHIRRYAGALTLSVVYGHRVTSNDDKLLALADECIGLLSNHIAIPGSLWLVDVLPFLKHIPTWFPLAGFKCNAIKWKARMVEFIEKPYAEVKQSICNGTAVPSFCSMLLEQEQSVDPQTDHDIKWAATSMYGASIDTTNTVMSHLILALILNPEKLAKAQREIDTVLSPSRLPTFADRAALPYTECIMSETLRWGAPVPLNLPHRLTEDDVYRGMHIPKGSLVMGNIWAMLRDETLFPSPEAFVPERYEAGRVDEATAKAMDPRQYIFGFGRRRCPGANLIESSLWLVIVSMLATLDISKALDEHGNAVEPQIVFDNMAFRTPNKFRCSLRPRSDDAIRFIEQTSVSNGQ